MAGYSLSPLEKKLGLKPGLKIKIINAPNGYFELFENFPIGDQDNGASMTKKDFIHYFTNSKVKLEEDICQLKNDISQKGMLWISWPKKASKTDTDLDGNMVRRIGLNNGLVDIKVCAIDETWSGLKFVIPVKDRI